MERIKIYQEALYMKIFNENESGSYYQNKAKEEKLDTYPARKIVFASHFLDHDNLLEGGSVEQLFRVELDNLLEAGEHVLADLVVSVRF